MQRHLVLALVVALAGTAAAGGATLSLEQRMRAAEARADISEAKTDIAFGLARQAVDAWLVYLRAEPEHGEAVLAAMRNGKRVSEEGSARLDAAMKRWAALMRELEIASEDR